MNEQRAQYQTKKFLAFDIEIAKQIPEGETDWKAHRPLGITCAAAYSEADRPLLWNWYAQSTYCLFADRMTWLDIGDVTLALQELTNQNYTLVTWNGLGFDFDILAEESQLFDTVKLLALDHIDIMFQIFCIKGFPVGLDAAARGMGLPGKPEGMDGSQAPRLWAEGQYHKVLEYVSQDAKMTYHLARLIEEQCELRWISRSGRENVCEFPDGLLTVRKCLELPLPDTSWMTREPWKREKFYGRLGEI